MTYKLAVILPSPYTGGVVRSLTNICRMLVLGARRCGDDLQLIVGLPKTQSWSLQNAAIFDELGIQTRFFEQKPISRESLMGSYGCHGIDTSVELPAEAICFADGIANFEDADFWYLISDAVQGPIPAHRKYACMVYDYANRYVPEIFGEEKWRDFHFRADATSDADFVVTTTRQARRDVINFAGADPDNVHVFPIEFDPIEVLGSDPEPIEASRFEAESFILWPTIISGHENHLPVLRELQSFLANNELQIIVVGKGTASFNPENDQPLVQHPYVEEVRRFVASSKILSGRMVFLDFVSDELLLVLMRRAICVLHTSRGDNGTYTVVEGAWQGTPALSNRYPAMEDVGEYFGLPLEFFDYYLPGSLADGLQRLLQNRGDICQRLPTRGDLARFSYDALAERYWQLFSTHMLKALGQQP